MTGGKLSVDLDVTPTEKVKLSIRTGQVFSPPVGNWVLLSTGLGTETIGTLDFQ